MGHSHGIYYACEFAKQYIKEIKYIISLDGSWISNELNKQRLLIWKNKGKIIPKINNQKTLDNIIDKINIPFITFRDFNSDVKDDIIMKQHNILVLQENNILSKYTNHIIYVLLDATHEIWLNDNYKNTIIQTLRLLI